MLQLQDGNIIESQNNVHLLRQNLAQVNESRGIVNEQAYGLHASSFQCYNGNQLGVHYCSTGCCYHTQWQSYPVYVTSDKTAKAIEILKKLEAEKAIEVTSVPRFIELVEQIAAIL